MVRFSWVWRALLRMGHPQVRWLVWLMTQDGIMPSQFQGAGALPLNRVECGKFPALFPLGCPTDGVKPPAEPTADCKGLTRLEELRLLNAVQTLRVRRGTGTDQGLRN